jgi:hypothetical protein
MKEPEDTTGDQDNNLEAWRNHALQGCLYQVVARDLEGAKDIPDAAVIWCAIQMTEKKEHRNVTSRAIARKVVMQMYKAERMKFKTLQTKAENLKRSKVRTRGIDAHRDVNINDQKSEIVAYIMNVCVHSDQGMHEEGSRDAEEGKHCRS